ncbi:MAG: cupredoxin domain-containing protein [Nitrososphaera sp.]
MKKYSNVILVGAVGTALAMTVALLAGFSLSTYQSADALKYKGQDREFYITNMDNAKVNETVNHIPPDVFNPTYISVKKGDHVTIHFYNVEQSADDKHSFTILEGPYKTNVILGGGQSQSWSFVANQTGIYTYFCSFHQPSMRGELAVEPPTYDEFRALH